MEAVRRNLLELMLKHIGDDVGSRGATPAFTFGDFNNVWVAERFHIQTLLRANLFVDAKDWGSPSKHIKKISHKRNGSRIDLRLANRSGSMLLRAYAVCDGILPNDRSELHIDIDLPIGKLWKYIRVQPNLNYDILHEIQVATSWILAPARNADDEIEDRRKLGFRPYRCKRRLMIFLEAACKCPAKPPSAEGRRAVSREVGVSLFATKRFICHTLVPVRDLPIAGVFRGLVSCQMLMPSLSLMWR